MEHCKKHTQLSLLRYSKAIDAPIDSYRYSFCHALKVGNILFVCRCPIKLLTSYFTTFFSIFCSICAYVCTETTHTLRWKLESTQKYPIHKWLPKFVTLQSYQHNQSYGFLLESRNSRIIIWHTELFPTCWTKCGFKI